MANTTITTGVQITVDASDIQNKFTKSVDELNASLSRSQKALGLVYNEQGILTNALGQTVEGLSQSSIKLGQYVDELGRVRTYQDGFIDGLTRTQIEMGFYADELGNVYNRLGEYVGMTDKATKATQAQAAAQSSSVGNLQRAIAKAAGPMAKMTGQFAIFQQLMVSTGVGATKTGQAIAVMSNAFSVAAGSFKLTTKFFTTFSGVLSKLPATITATTTAANTAAPAVAALSAETKGLSVSMAALGGPATLAISAITALAAGFAAWKATNPQTVTETLSTSFEDLQKRAEALGRSIVSVRDALEVGAFSTVKTDFEVAAKNLSDARDKLNEARDNLSKQQEIARKTQEAAGRYSGQYVNSDAITSKARTAVDDAQIKYKNEIANFNATVSKYVEQAREAQKTEIDKINEQKALYSGLLKIAQAAKNQENVDLFKRQIEALDKQIKEVREKELAAQKTKAEEAAKQAQAQKDATLQAAGIKEYIDKQKSAAQASTASLENYAATVERWSKLANDGALSTEDLTQAESALADQLRGELAKALGVDFKDATTTTADAMTRLQTALEQGVISQEQYNDATKQLKNKTLEALSRSTGVTFDKQDKDSYSAKIKQLQDALEQGVISQKQFNDATAQLKESARNAIGGLGLESNVAEYVKRVKQLNDAVKDGVIKTKDRDKLLNDAKSKLATAFGVSAEDVADFEKRRKKIESEFGKGLIDAQEREKRLTDATRKLEKAREQTAKLEELAKNRQNVRNALGVDSLMESLKTPVQKYKETLDKIAAAMRQNAIDFNEADALKAQAAEAYLKTISDGMNEMTTQEAASSQRGAEIARSLSSGSEELYLAQVRNASNSYQSTMQTATAQIQASSAIMANNSTLSLQYIQAIADAAENGVPVWP